MFFIPWWQAHERCLTPYGYSLFHADSNSSSEEDGGLDKPKRVRVHTGGSTCTDVSVMGDWTRLLDGTGLGCGCQCLCMKFCFFGSLVWVWLAQSESESE